jgi:hypothetical protein
MHSFIELKKNTYMSKILPNGLDLDLWFENVDDVHNFNYLGVNSILSILG